MTNAEEYLALEKEMLRIREMNGGADSPEEDAIMEKMDLVWRKMTDEELASLRRPQ